MAVALEIEIIVSEWSVTYLIVFSIDLTGKKSGLLGRISLICQMCGILYFAAVTAPAKDDHGIGIYYVRFFAFDNGFELLLGFPFFL